MKTYRPISMHEALDAAQMGAIPVYAMIQITAETTLQEIWSADWYACEDDVLQDVQAPVVMVDVNAIPAHVIEQAKQEGIGAILPDGGVKEEPTPKEQEILNSVDAGKTEPARKRGRPMKKKDPDEEQIIELHNSGMTIGKIAAQIGEAPRTVSKIIQLHYERELQNRGAKNNDSHDKT